MTDEWYMYIEFVGYWKSICKVLQNQHMKALLYSNHRTWISKFIICGNLKNFKGKYQTPIFISGTGVCPLCKVQTLHGLHIKMPTLNKLKALIIMWARRKITISSKQSSTLLWTVCEPRRIYHLPNIKSISAPSKSPSCSAASNGQLSIFKPDSRPHEASLSARKATPTSENPPKTDLNRKTFACRRK